MQQPCLLSCRYLTTRDRNKDISFEDVESIQTGDPKEIRDMMDHMPVTKDKAMLKSFLYAVGGAVSSFRYKWCNEELLITRKDIRELTLLFDNFHGNLSFGMEPDVDSDINVEKQPRHFFPQLFVNLNECFAKPGGKVCFFLAIRSVFGSAIQFEYAGSIPSLPALSTATQTGVIQTRLDAAARATILQQRSHSYFQKIYRWGLRKSTASYAHSVFHPLIVRFLFGHTEDIPKRVSGELIAQLLQVANRFSPFMLEMETSLPFRVTLPNHIPYASEHIKILRYLAYHTLDYFRPHSDVDTIAKPLTLRCNAVTQTRLKITEKKPEPEKGKSSDKGKGKGKGKGKNKGKGKDKDNE